MRRDASLSRREFVQIGSGVVAGAVGVPWVVPSSALGLAGTVAPSNRIAAASIGVGMMGTHDLQSFMRQFAQLQFVAVCDCDKARRNVNNVVYGWEPAQKIVEKHYAEKSPSGTYRGCKVYVDYRELLEQQKDLDAVLVATPDHTHAVISMAAMRKGKHVFCQKPLVHTVYEARKLAEAARQSKVATQCGTGNYTQESVFRLREWIADGAIGAVREVHNWSNRPVWPQGMDRPSETPPVPEGLDWDLWLGPAPYRPYHPAYLPFVWRGWWDFGTGALGDMGCYSFDVIFRVLKLRHPTKVEACGSLFNQKRSEDSFPQASIVRFQFPARGEMPPVKLTWYDGGLRPERPDELEPAKPFSEPNGGLLFIGEKGKILCDFTGANPRLIPESKMSAYKQPPKTLPRSIGHHEEWIAAIQGGEPPGANFEVAGLVSETLMLGNIALRTGKELLWDGPNLRIPNAPDAEKYIHPTPRSGWSL